MWKLSIYSPESHLPCFCYRKTHATIEGETKQYRRGALPDRFFRDFQTPEQKNSQCF